MLLINKTLLRGAKGLWGWIILISLMKIIVLVGSTQFAVVVSGFLGGLFDYSMTSESALKAILWAFLYACLMLAGELMIGETEYRCTAKGRRLLRQNIFDKILTLDVGEIEKIGPTSAIVNSVDGVEAMQTYYSKYLPSLIYSIIAPVYLFFRIKGTSFSIALFLMIVSLAILPVNNIFRQLIEKLKKKYWSDMEDLTGYYLESVRGLVTLKLFNQDEPRSRTLSEKAHRFCNSIMDMMKVNFTSFIVTDGIIYLSVFFACLLVCRMIAAEQINVEGALMILMMAFAFFTSVRSLMSATHTALSI